MRSWIASTLSPLAPLFGSFVVLLFAGCVELPSTQVMVIIDAEEVPRERIQSVRIVVYGSEEGRAPEPRAEIDLDAPEFPLSLALIPENDDETRQFGIEASGLGEESHVLAIVRARGAYVRREARTAVLRFEESCLGILDCHPDETCSLGRCLDAALLPEDYGTLERDGNFALPPYTVADHYTIPNHQPFIFNPSENDRDPQEEGLALVSGEVIRGSGSIELLPDGNFEYRSPAGYTGDVEAIYLVANPAGLRARGLIRLTVVEGDPDGIDPTLDSDGDGIPDWIEVQGCTDRYNADTDGDGIPDGIEDWNANGRVDRYETDPCKADSKGYGLCDGAYRESVNLAELGCSDFSVVFIDASRDGQVEADGRSWETAYRSHSEAVSDLLNRGAQIDGRQFWFRAGEYESPAIEVYERGVEAYGGFVGDERYLAERQFPLLNASYLLRSADLYAPSVRIDDAESVVIDGFALHAYDSMRDPSAGIDAYGVDGLELFNLAIDGLGADGDNTFGDISLENVNGLHLSRVFLADTGRIAYQFMTQYIQLSNVEGKLENLLLIGDYPDMYFDGAPLWFETSHSLKITDSRFVTGSPPIGGELYEGAETQDTLRFEFSNSAIEQSSYGMGAQAPGIQILHYRSDRAAEVRFSNLSYVIDPEDFQMRFLSYVLDSEQMEISKPLDFELAHITTSSAPLVDFAYLSHDGSPLQARAYNIVTELEDPGPADEVSRLLNVSSPEPFHPEIAGYCFGPAAHDVLHGIALIPENSACGEGVTIDSPPLAERMGAHSLAETTAHSDWRPDQGAPDLGYHAHLDAPRVLRVEGEMRGDECGWRIEARGECYLITPYQITWEFQRLPASGWLSATEGEGFGLLCLGDGPPVYLRSFFELSEPCL